MLSEHQVRENVRCICGCRVKEVELLYRGITWRLEFYCGQVTVFYDHTAPLTY